MELINGTTFGQVSGTIVILLVLLIASYFFNLAIEDAGWKIEGSDWWLVVIGVTYTQIAVGLLDMLLGWNAFFLGIVAYTASGFPMIAGAVKRNKDVRKRAEKALSE